MFSPLILCRSGFESEVEKELTTAAQRADIPFTNPIRFKPGAVLLPTNEAELNNLTRAFQFRSQCFARQLMFSFKTVSKLPERDKVSAILSAVVPLLKEYSLLNSPLSLSVDVVPENPAPGLTNFAKGFTRALAAGLKTAGVKLSDDSNVVLHLFFPNYETALAAVSFRDNSSPWQLGIPRLKFPHSAPSRSTLKLEEAFHLLLSGSERETLLRSGMKAVDLGAAPGGWTYQLVRRGIKVTAIDNGNIEQDLLGSGLVHHIRTDAFKFRPKQPVDWMVCDVVEQPSRIADLVALWLQHQLCLHTIFNLKLPMKKRFEEVEKCEQIIRSRVPGVIIRKKQLYHDREEVTCYAFVGKEGRF